MCWRRCRCSRRGAGCAARASPRWRGSGGPGGFAVGAAAAAGDAIDIGTGTPPDAPERRQVRINGAPASATSLVGMAVGALADPGDGPAVRRGRVRPPPLPRPAGAGARARAMPAMRRATRRRCARATSCWPRPGRATRPGWPRSKRGWPSMAPPSPRRAARRSRRWRSGWRTRPRGRSPAPASRSTAATKRDLAAGARRSAARARRGRRPDPRRPAPHRSRSSPISASASRPALCSTGEQKALLIGLILAHRRSRRRARRPPPDPAPRRGRRPSRSRAPRRPVRAAGRAGGQVWMTGTEREPVRRNRPRSELARGRGRGRQRAAESPRFSLGFGPGIPICWSWQQPPTTTATAPNSIKVLKGLDAVRKRPGMYIGDTDDGSGLHHMVFEVSDNAIDEALAGHCDRILITLNPDGSVSVEDNGRGIPTGIHAEEGVSAAEVIMTQLHAGGKFENTSDDNAYKVSGGLHGVGVSVVNALSRMARPHHLARRRGALHALPPRRCRGAAQDRRPRAGGQEGHQGHLPALARDVQDHRVRFRQARASLPRARLPQFGRAADPDRRAPRGGRRASSFITKAASPPSSAISTAPRPRSSPIRSRSPASATMSASRSRSNGTTAITSRSSAFTNNIPQRDGGTHLAAFRAALTRTLNNYADKSGMMKREKVSLTGDDMREGLTAIVSVKLPDPKFSSQTKDKLVSQRGPPAARKPDGRQARRMARGKSRPRPHDHPEDHRRRRRARGRPQGARGEPQER